MTDRSGTSVKGETRRIQSGHGAAVKRAQQRKKKSKSSSSAMCAEKVGKLEGL